MTNQSGSAFWTCPQCGGMGSIHDSRCPQCGAARGASAPATTAQTAIAPLVAQVSTGVQRLTSQVCPRCGHANSLFGLQCQACGTSLVAVRTNTTKRSRGVAIALAFFGGFIGAQYFYMGRRMLGVACVALCWSGYPAGIGIVEGIRLMTMSDAEFQQQCEG